MPNLKLTKHGQIRMQQRGFNNEILTLIANYGKTYRHKGADVTYIDKKGRDRMLKEMPATPKACEKALKGYFVEGKNGEIITTAIRFKHFRRDN